MEHFQLSDVSLVASIHLSWLALELSRTRVTKRGNFDQRCEQAGARGAVRRHNAGCEAEARGAVRKLNAGCENPPAEAPAVDPPAESPAVGPPEARGALPEAELDAELVSAHVALHMCSCTHAHAPMHALTFAVGLLE